MAAKGHFKEFDSDIKLGAERGDNRQGDILSTGTGAQPSNIQIRRYCFTISYASPLYVI